jgi:hypothetical protein
VRGCKRSANIDASAAGRDEMKGTPAKPSQRQTPSADRNLKELLHPDRARSDELGREADQDAGLEPGPRELPARAVRERRKR